MGVKFENYNGTWVAVIGKVGKGRFERIKWVICKEDCDLYSVRISQDGGRTARMIPRISVETNEDCYYMNIEDAKASIEQMEKTEA